MSSSSTTPSRTPSPSRAPSPPCSLSDIETYRSLFRRRKPPVSQPPVPCLCCAIKGMHCVYYKGDEQCQRCKRNGEEFCIYQRQDLTKPEEPLTQEQLEQERKQAAAAEQQARPPWFAHQPRPEPPLQCMVFSLDAELSQDRRRLLELATEMLQDAAGSSTTTHLHGITPVRSSSQALRNFALPLWHRNDARENMEHPEYCFRTHAHFFNGIEEVDRAAAAQGSWRLGQERRKAREELADEKRAEREVRAMEKREKEKEKGKESESSEEA